MIAAELCQLHHHFNHLFIGILYKVLEHAMHKTDKNIIDNLIKFCTYYQKHRKLSNYFKFTLKRDINFNYSIYIDIIYVNNSPILHIVNKSTRIQAGRWLIHVSSKHI